MSLVSQIARPASGVGEKGLWLAAKVRVDVLAHSVHIPELRVHKWLSRTHMGALMVMWHVICVRCRRTFGETGQEEKLRDVGQQDKLRISSLGNS